MGGGSYSRDVGHSSSSGSFYSGGTSSAGAKRAMGRGEAHKDTDPKRKIIRSERKSPIIFGLDATGSNREFARIFYDKAPMLHGQIEQQGYLDDFDICFSIIGDANSDRAPLQVCDFKYGIDLDDQLKKLWLEGGGGGQRMETYELAAHYFNEKCEMPNAENPFFFIIGDEAPYPYVEPGMAKDVMGRKPKETLESKVIFKKLYEKFKGNVWFLQNPYCGRRQDLSDTNEIREEWISYVGPENAEKIIPIHEEKSVVDVILGLIATTSKARDMRAYVEDMQGRGQTKKRIGNVQKSLKNYTSSLVVYSKAKLPATKGKSRKQGGKKL